jgi:anti-sigma factor ChrR (cupin superfamily)
MNRNALDTLAEYVLGTLSESERRALETEIAASPALRRELDSVREALGSLAGVEVEVDRAAYADGRSRLLEALASGDRYLPFLSDLSRHFDLAPARVRELFSAIDDAGSWEAGPMPGIAVMHFAGGPQAVAPDTGFVRLPRGLKFPYHRHVGNEVNYVLEGAVLNGDDGRLYVAGEAIEMKPGTAHEFSIPDDADALIAVVQAGFEFIPKPD